MGGGGARADRALLTLDMLLAVRGYQDTPRTRKQQPPGEQVERRDNSRRTTPLSSSDSPLSTGWLAEALHVLDRIPSPGQSYPDAKRPPPWVAYLSLAFLPGPSSLDLAIWEKLGAAARALRSQTGRTGTGDRGGRGNSGYDSCCPFFPSSRARHLSKSALASSSLRT